LIIDLLLKNGYVYNNDGSFIKADIAVSEGKIIYIDRPLKFKNVKVILDIKNKYVIPGTIDPHVHIREPGYDQRETFESGTKAAAAGGVTTIIEHPISNPPPYSPEILNKRIKIAEENSYIDFCFYGAAGGDKIEYIKKMGNSDIVAFKTFLQKPNPDRVDEFIGLTMSSTKEMKLGFAEIAKTKLICAVHAEDNKIIDENIKKYINNTNINHLIHTKIRPPEAEIQSVKKILEITKNIDITIEFVHISTDKAMELIKNAKSMGRNIILETCPHYLFKSKNDLKKLGPFAKSNPPLRCKSTRDNLWKYINDGTVDFIGSDHAPFTLSEKNKGLNNIFKAPAGFPGIEVRLPLILNAVLEDKLSFKRCIDLLSTNPAKIFNIYPQKGIIKEGSDADFVILDLNEKTIIKKEKLYTKAKDISLLYDNEKLKGKIEYTIVRGQIIKSISEIPSKNRGWGSLIKSRTQI
jgi:dihydropyrimidinase/allantoinase